MKQPKNLHSNIWKYTLLLIANKRVFVAILAAYYLTIPGVTEKSIGIILIAGQLAGFLFEIPSGYVSDKIGHKKALVLSRIGLLLSSMIFLLAQHTGMLVLGAVVMSFGFAFLSGTGSAFMHETLRGLQREKEYTQVMGKIRSIGFAIPIGLMVLVPFLVEIDFRLPFAVALVIDGIGLLATLSLVVPRVPQKHVEEVGVTNFTQVITQGKQMGFMPFGVVAGVLGGTIFAFSGFRAAYQSVLEIPVIYFGVFFGIGRALASLILVFSGNIKKQLTYHQFTIARLVMYTFLFLLLSLIATPWVVVVAFIIINTIQHGLSQVSMGYLIDVISKSKFKATLLSVRAQINAIVSGVLSFGLGFAIDATSYQNGFLMLTLTFVVISVPIYIITRKLRTK